MTAKDVQWFIKAATIFAIACLIGFCLLRPEVPANILSHALVVLSGPLIAVVVIWWWVDSLIPKKGGKSKK